MQDNSPLLRKISHAVKELNLSKQDAWDIWREDEGAPYGRIAEICQLIDSNIEKFRAEVFKDTSIFEEEEEEDDRLILITLYALERIKHVASTDALVYLFKVTGGSQLGLHNKFLKGDQVVDSLTLGMCNSDKRVARASAQTLWQIRIRGGVSRQDMETIYSLVDNIHPLVQPFIRDVFTPLQVEETRG